MALFDKDKFLAAEGGYDKIPVGSYTCSLVKWTIGPNKRIPNRINESVMQWRIVSEESHYKGQIIFLSHILEQTDKEPNYYWFKDTVQKIGFDTFEFNEKHEELIPRAYGTIAVIDIVQSKDTNDAGEPYLNPRLNRIDTYAYKSVGTSQVIKDASRPVSTDSSPSSNGNNKLIVGESYIYNGQSVVLELISPSDNTGFVTFKDGTQKPINDLSELQQLGLTEESKTVAEHVGIVTTEPAIISIPLETVTFEKGDEVEGLFGDKKIVGKVHLLDYKGDTNMLQIAGKDPADGNLKAFPCKKETVTKIS